MSDGDVDDDGTSGEGVSYRASGRLRRGGGWRRASIDAALFARVVAAKDGLGDILDVEEAYEANLGNYIDFESSVTAQLASDLVHPALVLDEIDHARRTIGRRLDNLLSTSFSLVEQVKSRLRRLGGRKLLKAFEAELDDLKLRAPVLLIVQAVRNHAQHEGSSVSGITLGHQRLEEGEQIVLERTITLTLNRASLRTDNRMSAGAQARQDELLDALVDNKGRIVLGALMRSYIAALSEVQSLFRRLVANRQADWSEANRAAMAVLAPENDLFVPQVVRVEAGRASKWEEITLYNVERIERLQKRNGGLAGLPMARLRH